MKKSHQYSLSCFLHSFKYHLLIILRVFPMLIFLENVEWQHPSCLLYAIQVQVYLSAMCSSNNILPYLDFQHDIYDIYIIISLTTQSVKHSAWHTGRFFPSIGHSNMISWLLLYLNLYTLSFSKYFKILTHST